MVNQKNKRTSNIRSSPVYTTATCAKKAKGLSGNEYLLEMSTCIYEAIKPEAKPPVEKTAVPKEKRDIYVIANSSTPAVDGTPSTQGQTHLFQPDFVDVGS